MTLREILETVSHSQTNDWTQFSCWGYGAGPSYKYSFSETGNNDAQPNVYLQGSFPNYAVYKLDIDVTIAWGYRANDEDNVITEDWARREPDNSPAIVYFWDFFYRGNLVYRLKYCGIDGSRFYCPLPDSMQDGIQYVTTEEWNLIRKLNELSNHSFIDVTFERTGLQLTDENFYDR